MQEGKLGLGKLSRGDLRDLVLRHLPVAGAGLDANLLPVGGDRLVITVNPALGVPVETLGFFAFHYAAGNVAAAMARPRFAALAILTPPGFPKRELETIAKAFGKEARDYGVTVVAGHTGAYKGLTLPVAVTTVVGERERTPRRPSVGDAVVVAGPVAAEAVWLLSLAGKAEVPAGFWRSLTPLPLALKLAKLDGVKLMHDVSEGGLLAALWDIAETYGVALSVSSADVPLAEGARELGVDPLMAPSYGALVVICSPDMAARVTKACGPSSAVIGRVTGGYGVFVDGKVREARRTWIDELYGEL